MFFSLQSIAQEKDGDCTQSGFQLAGALVCLDSDGPRGTYSTQTHAHTHRHTHTDTHRHTHTHTQTHTRMHTHTHTHSYVVQANIME